MYLFNELQFLPLLLLFLLWGLGGWLLTLRWFDLEPHERGLIGFGLGLVIANWLANFLARLLPLPAAFWGAALLTLGLGILAAWPLQREVFAEWRKIRWPRWLLFAIGVLLFTQIGRGLGLLDEYQNFPAISIMATGDIPPHLPGAPGVQYGYHYFLFLLTTQFMRLVSAPIWTAVDLAHSLTLVLAMVLAGLLAWRLTRNRTVAWVSAAFFALAGGTRWLLLLLPGALLNRISAAVTLIGSGQDTAPTLFEALSRPWAVAGAGPIPFPFAFVNGVNSPAIMALHGFGVSSLLILLLILLLAGRQGHWQAGIPLTILLASLALANEVDFVLLYLGILVVAIVWVIQNKTVRPPASARLWIGIVTLAGIFALIQGGFITEVLRSRLFPAGSQANSYFQVGFAVVPPTLVSSHLGQLSLFNPFQFLAALCEVGPLVLALPLVLVWGYKALREEKWFQAALVASALPSLLSVFVNYSGNAGLTATTRLLSNLFFVCKILAVPLLWTWLQHQPEWRHLAAYGLGLAVTLAGVVLLAIQLIGKPRPVYSYFLTDMDARFYHEYWDRLSPASAWVLDASPSRAETVFGRQAHTSSGVEWAVLTPEYRALLQTPDPYALNAAGYGYVYADKEYWKAHAAELDQPCVRILKTVEGFKQAHGGSVPDFRRLADLSGCR